MQKIIPHLWFDKEAKEAAEFYVSVFGKDSKVKNITTLHDTPSGSVDVVSFHLAGHDFEAISAGPLFKFNPSISFSVAFKTKEEVDELWNKLSPGGKVLMDLGCYPFSERYGWLQDKYNLSWQIIAMGEANIPQTITPVIMYVGTVSGKAEEAINFYVSVFPNSKVGEIFRYTRGQEPDKEGTVSNAFFTLEGLQFAAMDSALKHDFKFNEAISLIVNCTNQQEIDYYWEKLSSDPKSEQCGWLKDPYGVSWQIVPVEMNQMLQQGSEEQVARVTEAFLKMKKFDIAVLKEAYEGRTIHAKVNPALD
jgi:predicted 3-demethylubiquinone-9 3-methyltransferase (glyoxalase superfamily)